MLDPHARYTVVLKTLLDNAETKQAIDNAMAHYPIFTPKEDSPAKQFIPTREQLNEKILNHYKYREIGFETVGRFIDELQITMNEIMPFYNQMMRSVEMLNEIDDIFGNIDLEETFIQETENGTDTTAKTNTLQNQQEKNSNTFERKASDTPQGSIENLDNFMTEAQREKNDANNESDLTVDVDNTSKIQSSGKVTHTLRKVGNQGVNTYAHDIIEFRQTILNIEQAVIADYRLSELFMQIY